MRVDMQRFENGVGSDSPASGVRWAVGFLGCVKLWWRSGVFQGQRLRSQNKACGASKENALTRLTQTGEGFSLDSANRFKSVFGCACLDKLRRPSRKPPKSDACCPATFRKRCWFRFSRWRPKVSSPGRRPFEVLAVQWKVPRVTRPRQAMKKGPWRA